MSQPPRNIVVGVFENITQARQALAELQERGFREDQLGIITREDVLHAAPDDGQLTPMEEGATVGAFAGLSIGFVCALGAVTTGIPGVLIGGGLLATLLGGAGAGAAVGTVVGALIGLGVPEAEAQWYENEVQAGQVIVTVRSIDRYNEAFAVLRRAGAYDRESGRPALVETGAANDTPLSTTGRPS
jgi:hypothetical protein